jgi:DnaJ-class molecular chaperone
MRCERCNSSGFVADYGRYALFTPSGWFGVVHDICPDCKGTGITYCCDEAGSNSPNTYGSGESTSADCPTQSASRAEA